jgi:hypothetical protein
MRYMQPICKQERAYVAFNWQHLVEAMRQVDPYFEKAWSRSSAGSENDLTWYYWMMPQRGANWLPDWTRLLGRAGRHSRCEVLRQAGRGLRTL